MRGLAVLAGVLGVGAVGCTSGTYTVVSLEAAAGQSAPSGVRTIELQLALAGKMVTAAIHDRSAGDITFPTDATLQIRSGTGTMSILAIARASDGSELGRGSGSVTVTANHTGRVTIPIDFGTVAVQDMATADMPGADLAGDGAVAVAQLSMDHQPSYDYGTVVVGSTSAAAIFTISNFGGGDSGPLGGATLSGTNSGDFNIINDGCKNMTLAAGMSCTVSVNVTAQMAGDRGAKLSISASPGGTVMTSVSAHAVNPGQLSLTPSPVAFGGVLINGGTLDIPVTVKNVGGVDTGTVSMMISGTDRTQFSLNGGTCMTNPVLAPNASCTAIVRFAPTAEGSKTATLTANASPGGPGVASLQGTGLTGATLVFSPMPPGFGTVAAGNSSSQTLTLVNNGTQDSGPLPSPTLMGDSSFTVTGGTCTVGSVVHGGGSCTFTVRFAPTTFGDKTGTISVTASPGGTATASLAGTGSQVFTMTVTRIGNGTGTVAIDSVDCTSYPCVKSYTVTSQTGSAISYSDDPSSDFVGWGGDCSGTGFCILPMDQNRSVQVNFALKKVFVTVDVAQIRGAAGSVTASATPPGPALTCSGGTCSAQYDYGTNVTLTATPGGGGSLFQSWGWTLDGSCPNRFSNSCTTGALTSSFRTSVTFRPPINYMFVTSAAFNPQTFKSDLSGADLACDLAAKNGGLYNTTGTTPTHFKAWLSTGGAGGVAARSRLSGARGWIRPDGYEFADDLVNAPQKIFYPPMITELRGYTSDYPATGTKADGTAYWVSTTEDYTCNNWTFPVPTTGTHIIQLGFPYSGSGGWTAGQLNTFGCTNPQALYCFETQYNAVVTPPLPATARYAFVSTNLWTPTGGRGPGANSADARCNADKGSLPGTYAALLSTTTSAASTRFDLNGANWIRPDGTMIAESPAKLMGSTILAPIVQQSDGTYLQGFDRVWTGSITPELTSQSANDSCGDWTQALDNGDYGWSTGISNWFHDNSAFGCGTAQRVYCLQQ